MILKYLEIKTEKDIYLTGFLKKRKSNKCIVYIHGAADNFIDNKFIKTFMENIKKYNILFPHTQGSFIAFEVPHIQENGKIQKVKSGFAYEDFENSYYDIDAWIKYAENIYSEIVIIAHSIGCNKIINYMQKNTNHNIKKLILLAPQDTSNFNKLDIHSGMYEEAIQNIVAGCVDKILSKKFLGFSLISSETYIKFLESDITKNIVYKNSDGDYSYTKCFKIPTLILIGEKDIGPSGTEYMNNITMHASNAFCKILNNNNHTFKGYENELSKIIEKFLDTGDICN